MVDPPPSPLGTKLGAYEILGFIATGGMGTVYRAKNRVTDEMRALKVMRTELASRPDFVSRFFREAKLAASLSHPHLVRVFEPGMEGDTVFLPMELLQGETLADRIHRQGKISEQEALRIVREVGAAVGALHDKGILHRDLKPSNVFLAQTADGAVITKVIDLGAAKEEEPSGEATATGVAIGSPHYMSVEQASGVKDVDARADQYSLAVVLYQMLTGIRPYENDDSGHALAKLLAGAPFLKPREINAEVSADTEAAILRALSRDRGDRFATLTAFLSALPNAMDDSTRIAPVEERALAKRPAPSETPPGTSAVSASVPVATKERSKTIFWLGFAASALAVIGGIGWLATHRDDATVAPPAMKPDLAAASATPSATAIPSAASSTPSLPHSSPFDEATAVVDPVPAPTESAHPHSVSPTPSHKIPPSHPSTKPPPSAVPCTPTPGAPCL